eukprot:9243385-Heterocapsa_arctica.AAC.1
MQLSGTAWRLQTAPTRPSMRQHAERATAITAAPRPSFGARPSATRTFRPQGKELSSTALVPLSRVNAGLMEYGCATLQGTITSWWNYSRKRSGETCHLLIELAKAAQRTISTTISGALQRWIAEHGEETNSITPAEAKAWASTYRHQKQVVRAHQLPPGAAGPSTRRSGLQLKYKLGRNCYVQKQE